MQLFPVSVECHQMRSGIALPARTLHNHGSNVYRLRNERKCIRSVSANLFVHELRNRARNRLTHACVSNRNASDDFSAHFNMRIRVSSYSLFILELFDQFTANGMFVFH